jgi:histone acetyltransferase HTATIP
MSTQESFSLKERVFACQPDLKWKHGVVEEIECDACGNPTKYYVHLEGCDSRLDAWLPPEKLRRNNDTARPPSSKAIRQAMLAPKVLQTRFMLRNLVEPDAAAAAAAAAAQATSMQQAQSKKNVVVTVPPSMRARRDSNFFCRAKNVSHVVIGPYKVDAWYFSPYHLARPQLRENLDLCCSDHLTEKSEFQLRQSPKEPAMRSSLSEFVLHICPYCTEPFLDGDAVLRHIAFICLRHPPGFEIYRDPTKGLVVFEMDGQAEPVFTQHLALLCKLFLEHKALDYDTTPFVFYVLCSVDAGGCDILGYFSKEKVSNEGYNLSCILTLPQYQGRGIGTFLIDLSYELSIREGKSGSPEKPLSDFGERSYHSYWADKLMEVLAQAYDLDIGASLSMEYLIQVTGICAADIEATLKSLNILKVKGNQRSLHVTPVHIRRHELRRQERMQRKEHYSFHRTLLSWSMDQYVREPAHVAQANNANVVPVLLENENAKKKLRTQL